MRKGLIVKEGFSKVRRMEVDAEARRRILRDHYRELGRKGGSCLTPRKRKALMISIKKAQAASRGLGSRKRRGQLSLGLTG